MISFSLSNPTRINFGKGAIATLTELVAPGTQVLLVYGGGSIKRNGVYDQVSAALSNCTLIEFGGIEVNPHYETIQKAAALAKQERAELILAVGGGSVADAAKFLASAAVVETNDPWDDFLAGRYPDHPLPVGVILTLPATGSESNAVSVISSVDRHLKMPFKNQQARPKFAILDSATMASLDQRQLSNGVVDAFTHVLEQYATVRDNTPIQHGFSETLLKVLLAWGPELLETNSDEARENVLWAANQALNGLIAAGVREDWSTHMIGHALTELYGIDHARSLTLVMPTLFRSKIAQKRQMLAQCAREVWQHVGDDDNAAAVYAIDQIEDFFVRMGAPVCRADIAPIELVADDVVDHLLRAGQLPLGEGRDIGAEEVRSILNAIPLARRAA